VRIRVCGRCLQRDRVSESGAEGADALRELGSLSFEDARGYWGKMVLLKITPGGLAPR
jgi:hypothetical protein